MPDSLELQRLAELHQRGALSDAEFAQAKARLLNGPVPAAAGQALVTALNHLRRSRQDCWLGGLCGGLARSTGLASWVFRLVFVLLLMCAGSGILLYVVGWLLIPQEDVHPALQTAPPGRLG